MEGMYLGPVLWPAPVTQSRAGSSLRHDQRWAKLAVPRRCAQQAGDLAACQAALRPAWEAIASGAHKAPSPNPAHKRLAYLRSFTAAWVYTMMATIGVSLLERQRKYVEATDMLRQLLGAIIMPCQE